MFQSGNPRVMQTNGKEETPLTLADEDIRVLLTTPIKMTRKKKPQIVVPRYSSVHHIKCGIDVLTALGIPLLPNFRPPHGRFFAALYHFAKCSELSRPESLTIIERIRDAWVRGEPAFSFNCALYVSQFMCGPTFAMTLDLLEFTPNSTFYRQQKCGLRGFCVHSHVLPISLHLHLFSPQLMISLLVLVCCIVFLGQ
jgi:hypothetical protein